MAKLKLLFVGLGSIGQRHLRNACTLLGDQVELLAYRARGGGPVLNADMSIRANATLESAYPLRTFATLEDALNEWPDAVFITNPHFCSSGPCLRHRRGRRGPHVLL